MSRLESFLGKAVHAHSEKNSAHLGDRSKYIGASDIAACARKAVMSKLYPVPHSTKQLLIFARGHAAQAMYADIFRAGGATFEEEAELVHPDFPHLKCHIDFLFTSKARLHVVEVKSTDGIPEEPYSSWVDQLHFQMGLAHLRFGNDVEIGGSILCVDLNTGEYKEFNSYKPNVEIFNYLTEKGNAMWEAVQTGSLDGIPHEPGLLCDHCSHRTGCPSLSKAIELPEEVAEIADLYEKLGQKKKLIDGEMETLKDDLLYFTGQRSFKGTAGNLLLATTYFPVGETVDSKKLKSEYPEAFKACKKAKKAYTKLEVKRLPPVIEKEEKLAA